MILDFIFYIGTSLIMTLISIFGSYACFEALYVHAYYPLAWMIFLIVLFFAMWSVCIIFWQMTFAYLKEVYFK